MVYKSTKYLYFGNSKAISSRIIFQAYCYYCQLFFQVILKLQKGNNIQLKSWLTSMHLATVVARILLKPFEVRNCIDMILMVACLLQGYSSVGRRDL